MKFFKFTHSEALDFILKSTDHVLILGKAGTGKTTLIKNFYEKANENAAIVAPTGIAALNAGGRTIHSFFRFNPGITQDEVIEISYQRRPPKIITNLETLIIDEISMVRADLLDCVELYLRLARNKNDIAFGGVRIIMAGDLLQLPPVVQDDEKKIFEVAYDSEFFFSSNAFSKIENDLIFVELNEVYRQESPEFIALLDRIRLGKATIQDIELLNSKVVSKDDIPENTIILSPYKAKVAEINLMKLEELKGKTYEFEAIIKGEIKENQYPADETLVLKKGAQVVMLNNDKEKRWVNGSIGVVEKIYDDFGPELVVRLDNGCRAEVTPYKWEIFKFFWDDKEKKIKREVVGTFEQLPVKPAWAMTIHKSQGMTFERVAIDLDEGAFASGQLYVALSRARSLEGIYLLNPIYLSDIKVDWRIISYLDSIGG